MMYLATTIAAVIAFVGQVDAFVPSTPKTFISTVSGGDVATSFNKVVGGAPKQRLMPLSMAQESPETTPSTAYTQDDFDLALAYLESVPTFTSNYYTIISTTLRDCFDTVDNNIPDNLLDMPFTVDFSTRESTRLPPLIIKDGLRVAGVKMYQRTDRDTPLADIIAAYEPDVMAAENRVWWLAHCQALRDGEKNSKDFIINDETVNYSGTEVLANEYYDGLRYFVKDSLYDTVNDGISDQPDPKGLAGYWEGRTVSTEYEDSWWALLSNKRVQMTWPRVTFDGDEVAFDWICFDVNTNEATAYGNVVFFRAGDVGAAYKKYEHLYYLRDAYKPFFDAYYNGSA